MRTDLNSGGFTLYEILFSNTIVGIKTGLLSVSLSSLLDRFVYLNTAVQFKDTLRLAHLLALNKRKFHRLKSEYRKLPLQRKKSSSCKTVWQKKVPGKISISTTHYPSFCFSALPLMEPLHSKLRITAQKSRSVRLDVSE